MAVVVKDARLVWREEDESVLKFGEEVWERVLGRIGRQWEEGCSPINLWKCLWRDMLSLILGIHSVSLESVFMRYQVDGEPNATFHGSCWRVANGYAGLFMAENHIDPPSVELHNYQSSQKRATCQVNSLAYFRYYLGQIIKSVRCHYGWLLEG